MPSAFMSMSAMICDRPIGEPCPRCCYRGNCVTPRLCIGGGALTLHQPIRPERPLSACAVKRRRFSSGCKAHPASLQPEATGAGMEVTKCLKPPDSGHEFGDRASAQ